MAKGVSIKFVSYRETIPKLLKFIKLHEELKKHNKIILKPNLRNTENPTTSVEFTGEVLKFCKTNAPEAEILIAEGSDGQDTLDVFHDKGYQALAEKYGIGLIDLNETETQKINDEFSKFTSIQYPKLLLDAFIISLPNLQLDQEAGMLGSLENMLGIYPAKHYSGFFSSKKNKIRKWPIKYSIHDIVKCKMPELAVIDASGSGFILAGRPLEMDQQAAKLLGQDWRSIPYLKLISESFSKEEA